MKKGRFTMAVSAFMKAFADKETNKKTDIEEDDDLPEDDDLENDADTDEDDEEMKKSESEIVDATDVMRSLVFEFKTMNKALKTLIEKQETLEKSQSDVGEAVIGVAEMLSKVANTPMPTKTIMAKSQDGTKTSTQKQGIEPLTQAEFKRAQQVLVKAYKDGEISLMKSEQISSDLQKAMHFGYELKQEDYNFLAKKMNG